MKHIKIIEQHIEIKQPAIQAAKPALGNKKQEQVQPIL